MNKIINTDLGDLTDILESFTKKLDKLSEADLIDLAARLKPVAKHCEAIDKYAKEMVKTKLRHKEGSRLGEMFKAVLKLVPVDRLDQKAFKAQMPEVHASFIREDTDERVSFELR